MKIQFINHSCVLVSYQNINILCDPWFFGSAFQDGWSLLYDESHNINELNFDYIWISHEHPDHFSIPTLSSLEGKTKFLYQKTSDRKVKNYLESKGHEVIELEHNKQKNLEGISLTLFVCDGYDSSILFESKEGHTFLNINDARVDLDNHLESEIMPNLRNKVLDMVGLQFSYANWAGNEGDKEISLHQQTIVDEKNNYVVDKLKPKTCLLMASFVYFSHQENYYWNDNFYLDHVVDNLNSFSSNTQTIVPMIDQIFDLSNLSENEIAPNNIEALNFWSDRHHSAPIKFHTKSIKQLETLKEEYFKFFDRVSSKNTLLEKIRSKSVDDILSLEIFLSDIQKKIKISLLYKDFNINEEDESENLSEYDVSITSETFVFLMKNDFARGTININSRISFNYQYAYKYFFFFLAPYSNNIGKYYHDPDQFLYDLRNVQRTSIMLSILHFNVKAAKNFDSSLNSLVSILNSS